MSLTFAYRARTPGGERVAGTMRALDRRAAFAVLRERMLVPSRLEAVSGPGSFGHLFPRRRSPERLAFFRAYAALEHAGVDFSTAFELLIAQARTTQFREALRAIRSDVERCGEKLWVAMSHRPRDFSDLEVAMVAAGEEAGNREDVFDRLAGFLERDERLRKRLGAVLLYPAFVLGGAFAVSVYLLIAIVPQFARLFKAFDVSISPVLSLLLWLSGLATNPLAIGAGAGILLVTTFVLARLAAAPEGARALDRFRLGTPLFGRLIRKISAARISRVLATLLESGVNQLRALEVAIPVVESPVLASALERARNGIAAGKTASLDEAFEAAGVFEPLLIGFVRVGAQTGDIPHMLSRIADYYEDDAASILATLPTLIQTSVTLALGVLVAAIVYVVYVPLTTLSSSIH
jgi:type IV pilus assembly protein PilC